LPCNGKISPPEELKHYFSGIRSRWLGTPRGDFCHRRTVSQAAHANRDIDQVISAGADLTSCSVEDRASHRHQ
jgi:hypothetical protein